MLLSVFLTCVEKSENVHLPRTKTGKDVLVF